MAFIVLFAVFQSIWLVANCQEKKVTHGIVKLPGDDNWRAFTKQNITLIPMEEPTKKASPMKWIETLETPNNFDVHRMEDPLKSKINSLKLLPLAQFRNQFAEIIQKAFYEDILKEHSDWIVIPFGISKIFTKEQYLDVAHIDLLGNADIGTLLQRHQLWSCDFMEFLGMNNHVKAAALAHYNGNVEQYAMEMLTLDYTMNIWIPTEPVQAWPLAFTTGHQCDETRTMTPSPDMDDPHKYLLQSESTSNDWYTRWNMQTDELYVWDSRKVAHAAVKIGDGTGKRSSIEMRLVIVHPTEDRLPPISSPFKHNTLCYTKRLFKQMRKFCFDRRGTIWKLTKMGYGRRCDPPSNFQALLKHKPGILSYLRKFVGKFYW